MTKTDFKMENNQTKKCNKCQKTKDLSLFYKDSTKKDGYSYCCKKCQREITIQQRRTKDGVAKVIFRSQVQHSKSRNHKPPTYTNEQLKEWLFNQPLFHKLYDEWVLNDYDTDFKPSIDRRDDNEGYSFDNIKLMTWQENNNKASLDMRNGKLKVTSNPQKKVIQCSLDGMQIKEFSSLSEAQRQTNVDQGCISKSCNNQRETAGGFIWRFKNE